MSAISSSRSFWRSSSAFSSSSRLGIRRPRNRCPCLPHMFHLLRSIVEKVGESVPQCGQRLEPGTERGVAVVGQRVRALRGSGQVGLPFRDDEPVLLEPTEDAVEISNVYTLLAQNRGETLEQLVSVSRTLCQKAQERRLAEALDPGTHGPGSILAASTITRAPTMAMSMRSVHGGSLYE